MLKSLRDLGFAKTGSEEAILEESALLIKNINKGKNSQTNFKNKFYLCKAKKKKKKNILTLYVDFNFEPIKNNWTLILSLTHMAYFSQCDADNFFFISLTLYLIFSYFL